jgi:hypothetical protein
LITRFDINETGKINEKDRGIYGKIRMERVTKGQCMCIGFKTTNSKIKTRDNELAVHSVEEQMVGVG